jgi:hypothetical protein
MNKSESITKLAQSLVKAQAEMPHAKFDATNPFLKNRYASLGSVIEASKPILAKYGLSVSQMVISSDGGIGIETVLIHESGEWFSNSVTIELTEEKGKSYAQVAGSIVSYLRRYSLSSILNMYADEDTDGNQPKKVEPKQELEPSTRPYSPERLKDAVDKKAAYFKNEIASGKQKGATANHRSVLAAGLGKIFIESTPRYELCKWLTGTASTKEMDASYVFALLGWLNVKSFEDEPNEISRKEAMSAHAQALIASGQQKLIEE